MCMLSYYPSGVIPEAEDLLNGITWNQDGAGFALIAGDTLIVEHSVDNPEALAERFVKLRKRHPEHPAMFHSRMSTGGVTEDANCHPYRVGGDNQTVIGHNGIFFPVPATEKRSDTKVFAEDIFPGRFRKLDSKRTTKKLTNYVTSRHSKLAVITNNPAYKQRGYLIGAELGMWRTDGAWHSNSDWQFSRPEPKILYPVRQRGYEPSSDSYSQWWEEELARQDARNERVWASEDSTDCDLCWAVGSVDSVTWVCGICNSCQDCGMDAETGCLCYTPERVAESAGAKAADANAAVLAEIALERITRDVEGRKAIEAWKGEHA